MTALRAVLLVLAAMIGACEGAAEPAELPVLARALAPLPRPHDVRPPALSEAPTEPTPWQPPLAGLTRGTPAATDWAGPCSRGPTHGGALTGGATMPDRGEGFALLPQTVRRDARHGHPTLVAAILRAARRIHALHPGSTLHVGDLSTMHGGNFGPHRSHTNGRDVDLAFYLASPAGEPDDLPRMVPIGPDGAAPDGRRFDAARNWALVALLLQDPGVQVQWVFVAAPLRASLLAEAARGDPALAERAERVLLQPRDSSPHADHFHIRIYCARGDRLGGCVDAPPFHPWVDDHRDALSGWLASVEPFLALPGTAEFRYAVTRIAEGQISTALPLLVALPPPPDRADALLVSDAIAHLRGQVSRPAWSRLRPEDAPP